MGGIHFKVHHLPHFIWIWFLITFSTTYLMSVLGGHVYPLFPFISDTGALPPESCIFAQSLNIGAILMGTAYYLRYLQIQEYIAYGYIKLDPRWNKMSLLCIGFIYLGMSIVANFQETAALFVHLLGAISATFFGVIYYIVQTRIGYESVKLHKKNSKHGISERMFYLRVGVASLLIISYCVLSVTAASAYQEFIGSSIEWWTEEDGGFGLHLIATVSEWIFAVLIFIYLASFTGEFKVIKYEGIKIKIVELSDSRQTSNGNCSTR